MDGRWLAGMLSGIYWSGHLCLIGSQEACYWWSGGFWQGYKGAQSASEVTGSGLCFWGLGARPHTSYLWPRAGFCIPPPHFLLMGQIFGRLTPCSCLTTCLSPQDIGTQVIGERGGDCSGFFLLDGHHGVWVLMPTLCQGAHMEEDVHGMTRPLVPT